MKNIILTILMVSIVVASCILYFGIQHNAMGEFCVNPDTAKCQLDFGYAFGIWVTWFLVFSLPTFGIVTLAKFLLGRREKS